MILTNLDNMPHQTEALKKHWKDEAWAFFFETGLGKTKTALDNGLLLWQAGKITGMLVMAPKGAYRTWSDIEIPKLMPDIPYQVAVWSAGMGLAERELIKQVSEPSKAFRILVMNTEGVNTRDGIWTIDAFLSQHKTLWVLDESTSIKNPKAQRSQNIITRSRKAPYRRIMSGFPINKEPADIYNQLAFLQNEPLGFRSWYAFRNCFQVMKPMAIGKRIIQVTIGTQNEDILNHRLKTISSRYTKVDCLKYLPPKTYAKRIVELTPEQKKHYDNIKHDAFTILSETEMVTTPLVISQIIRLHQVVCGFIVPDKAENPIDLPNNRIASLLEILEEHDGKVVIWADYQHNIRQLHDAIAKQFGIESVATYYGETLDKDRTNIIKAFQDSKNPLRYFVGNPSTGKFSLTLIEAHLCVYFSNRYDLEARRQSEDRLHRTGQKNAVTYIDLICPKTVDEKIVKNLMRKQTMSAAIMGDKWQEWFE